MRSIQSYFRLWRSFGCFSSKVDSGLNTVWNAKWACVWLAEWRLTLRLQGAPRWDWVKENFTSLSQSLVSPGREWVNLSSNLSDGVDSVWTRIIGENWTSAADGLPADWWEAASSPSRHIIKITSYTPYIHYITFHFKMRHPALGGNEQKLLPDKMMTAGKVELAIK